MTSNQIAYNANLESHRHNEATEANAADTLAETIRHNMALEDLQARMANIQQDKNQADIAYRDQALALDKWYKKNYLEWEKASGSKKLSLEEHLNKIKENQVELENQYRIRVNELKEVENSLTREMQDQIRLHNSVMEGLEATKIDNENKWRLMSEDRQRYEAEAQATYQGAMIGLKQNENTLSFQKLQLEVQKLELQTLQTSADIITSLAQTKIKDRDSKAKILLDSVDTVRKTADTVLKYSLGGE